MLWKSELHQCHFCNLVGKHAIKSHYSLCCLGHGKAGKKKTSTENIFKIIIKTEAENPCKCL